MAIFPVFIRDPVSTAAFLPVLPEPAAVFRAAGEELPLPQIKRPDMFYVSDSRLTFPQGAYGGAGTPVAAAMISGIVPPVHPGAQLPNLYRCLSDVLPDKDKAEGTVR